MSDCQDSNSRRLFSSLSDKQLRDYLMEELNRDDIDTDLIDAINEEVAKRQGPQPEVDVEAAWEDLLNIYSDGETIYPIEEDLPKKTTQTLQPHRGKKTGKLIRIIAIAAVLVGVFFVSANEQENHPHHFHIPCSSCPSQQRGLCI